MKRRSQGSWRRAWIGSVAVGVLGLVAAGAAEAFSMGEPCLNCDASASADGRFALSSSLIASEGSGALVGGGFSLEGEMVPWSYLQHKLSGRVFYYAGNFAIPGVEILDDANPGSPTVTGSDGTFAFTVPNDSEHSLTASKSSDGLVAQGVTTLDIILLRRHILGLAALDSPYKMLAGDVNASGTLTTLDIGLIRRVVLGLASSFPAGLWRFVPSTYVFPDATSPFGADRSLHSGPGTADLSGQDFVGIKLGDVNESWTPSVVPSPPPTLSLDHTVRRAGPVGLKSDAKSDAAAGLDAVMSLGAPQELGGREFQVPLNIASVRALTGLQCSLQWNPGLFEWIGVSGTSLRGVSEGNLNVQRASQGELVVSWDDPEGTGISASDTTECLSLRFRRIPAVPCGGEVRFMAGPIPVEVASGYAAIPVRCQNGWVQLGRPRDASALVVAMVTGDTVELQVPTWVGLTSVIELSETLAPARWTPVDSVEGDGTLRKVMVRSSPQGQSYYRTRSVAPGW